MQKNKIISILLTCAVLFSAFAGFLIYHYMAPTRATIYVFNADYSSGTQITKDMLTPLQVDSTIVSGGSSGTASTVFVTPSDYAAVIRAGDSLRIDVGEGMPLTTSMLSVTGGSKIEMNMKSDMIAVTIPVDNITGVTNELKDGAYVNIYATDGDTTVMLQQMKRILEVFRSDSEITGVALEESKRESMELINAVSTKSIYLGLIDNTGYQVSEGSDDPYYTYEAPNKETDEEPVTTDLSDYLPEYTDSLEETEAETEPLDGSGVFGN